MVPATGTFVLMYHLLWELTHVCFEHPGLLKPDADECTDEVCVTCSDEGRLGEVIVEPADATSSALVRTAAGEEWVDVTMLGDVAPNDLVLVHAGAAITRAGRHRSRGAPMTESENTGFLYPFIESEETDATSLLDDLAASARGKAAESARLQGESLDEYARRADAPREPRWPNDSAGADGSTHSATAAVPPTPRRWHRCSAGLRAAVRSRRGRWPPTTPW